MFDVHFVMSCSGDVGGQYSMLRRGPFVFSEFRFPAAGQGSHDATDVHTTTFIHACHLNMQREWDDKAKRACFSKAMESVYQMKDNT